MKKTQYAVHRVLPNGVKLLVGFFSATCADEAIIKAFDREIVLERQFDTLVAMVAHKHNCRICGKRVLSSFADGIYECARHDQARLEGSKK